MRSRFAVCSVAALLLPVKMAAPPVLAVGVRNVTTALLRIAGEALVLDVRFDGVLRHASPNNLHIGPGPVFVVGVDRLRGERWDNISRWHWYDIGQIKYQPCVAWLAREDEPFILPSVQTEVQVEKADAHSHVVVRFQLQAACKEGETVFIQPLVTDPVDLQIPITDEHKTESNMRTN
ncbi:MAG: hypothetical protein ABSH46_02655 [Bryobacteraceae bacterium]